ncbi:unnamed protein product, partial [Oppiella nova]
MTLKCGIVGLPNVGKSTLFNALTASCAAEAANYPFCTIEPNSGIVSVPDERLHKLSSIVGSSKIIPTYIEFVDIAGLVKGASKGEGLGNKFLSHIREVDAIIHVLRCFEDIDITHVYNKIDPLNDAEIIETELILADLESVQKRLANSEKRLKSNDKTLQEQINLLNELSQILAKGKPARELTGLYDQETLNQLQLLTLKPVLYVCNVLEQYALSGNKFTKMIEEKTQKEDAQYVIISSKIEAEIATLENEEEKKEFLSTIGLIETGLKAEIATLENEEEKKEFLSTIGLIETGLIGPKEAHAWTFKNGTTAAQGAGIIHTDFEKGSEVKAKEMGKLRLEGKDYKMQDGFAFGILSLGRFSDIWGRRPIILFGLLIYIISSISSIFVINIKMLMILRFCQAFGASVGSVIGQAMARDSYQGSQNYDYSSYWINNCWIYSRIFKLEIYFCISKCNTIILWEASFFVKYINVKFNREYYTCNIILLAF